MVACGLPGISMVTTWEQNEEEEEGDDGEWDLNGFYLLLVLKHPTVTLCLKQEWEMRDHFLYPSFSGGLCLLSLPYQRFSDIL